MFESPTWNKPDVGTVERRAICLRHLAKRWELETYYSLNRNDDALDEIQTQVAILDAVIRRDSMSKHYTTGEKKLLEMRVGSWTEHHIHDGLMMTETLGSLLWALHELDGLPALDQEVDLNYLFYNLPRIKKPERFLGIHRLRDDKVLTRENLKLSGYLVRATLGIAPPDGVAELRDLFPIQRLTRGMIAEGLVDRLIDGDLPVGARPFSDLSRQEMFDWMVRWLGRQQGLKWLLGGARYPMDW